MLKYCPEFAEIMSKPLEKTYDKGKTALNTNFRHGVKYFGPSCLYGIQIIELYISKLELL